MQDTHTAATQRSQAARHAGLGSQRLRARPACDIRVKAADSIRSHSTIERPTAEVSRVDDGLAVACDRRPIPVAHYRGNRHNRYAHTDARSAKKDVISTKPQKAMGAERTFPREQKRKSTTKPPSQVTPAKCRRSRGMLSCVSRAGGGGGHSHGRMYPW